MTRATAEQFWNFFREELRRCGSWQTYLYNKKWTPVARKCAEVAFDRLGMGHEAEAHNQGNRKRSDLRAWFPKEDPRDCGGFEVRYEQENDHQPIKGHADEIRKLAVTATGLRILVAFHHYGRGSGPEAETVSHLRALSPEAKRVPGDWLFIFGPTWNTGDDARTLCRHSFVAFFAKDDEVTKLCDDVALSPANWPDFPASNA